MKKLKKLAIIPAYNEEDSILRTVEELKTNAPDFDYVVINDGSKDNTLQVCREHKIHVLNLPVNLGIGGAVQTGYLYAYDYGYDIVIQFDGDGQHDASYLSQMTDTLIRENADMVIGSRFLAQDGFRSTHIRRIGIRYFTVLIRLLFGKKITDATSGMRLCNRRVVELFVKDYPRDYPEPETVCRLLRKKYKVVEMPVKMRERQGGISSISPGIAVYYMVKVSLAILIERLR